MTLTFTAGFHFESPQVFDYDLTWYLAGPMSGIPRFNIPTFDRVTRILRDQGVNVLSPAELDGPEVRAALLASKDGKFTPEMVKGSTWGDFLSRDVKLISDKVDGIIFLPNWQTSRGARLEAFVGLLCEKRFAYWDEMIEYAHSMPVSDVRHIIREFMP